MFSLEAQRDLSPPIIHLISLSASLIPGRLGDNLLSQVKAILSVAYTVIDCGKVAHCIIYKFPLVLCDGIAGSFVL